MSKDSEYNSDSTLRVAGIVNDSITDGPGLRLTVFFQGCLMNCPGCHNPDSLDPNGGTIYQTDEIIDKINKNPLLSGVTFSGGEPFLQAEALLPLARFVKDLGLDLAIYTGYTFEDLVCGSVGDKKSIEKLLNLADTLIDGPFILEQRSLTLPFRGSQNQRILDVQKSLTENAAVWSTDSAWID